MTSCDTSALLPLAAALEQMHNTVQAVAEEEKIALHELLDRVTATTVESSCQVPGYDNSAMDGYALRAADAEQPLQLIGQSLAGHSFSGTLAPGQCVRITTGAAIPAGADTVVMQENTQLHADKLQVQKRPQAGDNIRRAGEDIQLGQQVFPAGHRLGPVDIALLASLGLTHLRVKRRLKVAIFSTGDELVAPGQPLAEGQIYDSNRYAIHAVLQRLNVEVLDLGLLPDQPEALRAALQRLGNQVDAIISSGGVSVGEADYVKDILTELGTIDFWQVAIKPGKPFAFGRLNRAFFFGLPGNPVSALVTLHQLALPALRALAGETPTAPLVLQATAASDYKKRPGRQDFQRGFLQRSAGSNHISRTGAQGSGVLSSFLGANAYAVLEAERGAVKTGDPITVIPFDRFLT